jgi:hypothetical protein
VLQHGKMPILSYHHPYHPLRPPSATSVSSVGVGFGVDDNDDSNARQKTLDFAPPGPTTRMYDAVLDGMACMEEGTTSMTTLMSR